MRIPHAAPPTSVIAQRADPQAPALEPLSAVLGGVGNQVALTALTEGDALDGLGLLTHDAATLLIAGITPQVSPGEGSNAAAQAVMRLARAEGVHHATLAGLRLGGGQPLPPAVLARVSAVFGHDFRHVRVHQDAAASRMAEAANARAFTVGSEIWFNTGELDLSTAAGVDLLLHELTHVLQADEGRLPRPDGPGLSVSSPSDPHEQEAMRTAAAFAPELEAQLAATGDALIGEGLLEEASWGEAVDALPGPAQAPNVSIASRQDKKRPQDEGLACGAEDEEESEGDAEKYEDLACGDDYEEYPASADEDEYSLPEDFIETEDDQDLACGDDEDPSFSVDQSESERIEDSLQAYEDEDDWSGVGTSAPAPAAKLTGGQGAVTPSVAFQILENLARGEPPFKPELGKGGCSWFISEGTPYAGSIVGADKSVTLPVEITRGQTPLTFTEATLIAIRDAKLPEALEIAERQLRQRLNLAGELTEKHLKTILRNAKKIAESWMWDEVGKQTNAHATKVSEVILENSEFSKQGNGKFLVVADATKIQVKGGVPAVVGALEAAGVAAEPPVVEAATALARQQRWVGRVQSVFHYGGRVLMVVAIAADTYKIYTAENRVKATVEVAGGWAGATGAAALFAEVAAPANAAGPWAWAAYGVGVLLSGATGYWIGSETTSTVYELVLE